MVLSGLAARWREFWLYISDCLCLVQAAQQHVPQDANLVLSQDELKLGERLILHLRSIYSSLPES